MFILKKAVINKYKSYTTESEVKLEEDITVLVGKNESGKSAFLEALAKFHYFTHDEKFKFDATHDYPRRELTKFRKSKTPFEVIKCFFEIDEDGLSHIANDIGEGVFTSKQFTVAAKYGSVRRWGGYTAADERNYIDALVVQYDLSDSAQKLAKQCQTVKDFIGLSSSGVSDAGLLSAIDEVNKKIVPHAYPWDNLIEGYVVKHHLTPNLPRFWYFNEYHELPSRISIEDIKHGATSGDISQKQLETAKALFELANIDIDELLQSDDFESFVAELEATANEVTDKIFDYWSTNDKLEIQFAIESKPRDDQAPEKILHIRIKDKKNRVSLPLTSRSKGFNWFFSFIVWFSKIQDEESRNFILLLDEPGLNLHASAQADLLRFIEELSEHYQILYTTHSPFMLDAKRMNRVRTVYDSDNGSMISDVLQEQDPDTLFPLQAAIGYGIAQNLSVSQNNLLVESPAAINYLTFMSNLLESEGRAGLRDDITLAPVGGLDKVMSFTLLLRDPDLNVACLFNSFDSVKSEQSLSNMIQSKILQHNRILFFDKFSGDTVDKADIEDMFEKSEYLRIFGEAFPDYKGIVVADLDETTPTVLLQLKAIRSERDFNHYKPSQVLLSMGLNADDFSNQTLDRFETIFSEINKLF